MSHNSAGAANPAAGASQMVAMVLGVCFWGGSPWASGHRRGAPSTIRQLSSGWDAAYRISKTTSLAARLTWRPVRISRRSQSGLEFLRVQIARVPTRQDLARAFA